MCILFTHVDPDPKEGDYRLVVASNRDEYFRRPSLPVHTDGETNIIGGKDMEPTREGGMWLGCNVKGENGKCKKLCFAALLNLTGNLTKNNHARGFIVRDYLVTSDEFNDYVNKIEKNKAYNGYSLVAVELSKDGALSFHHSNIPMVDSVYSGKHTLAFGNSPAYSPLSKVMNGRRKFKDILSRGTKGDQLADELIQLLKDKSRHLPDLELQERCPEGYEHLSSIYVDIGLKGYGTRTHSVILVDYDWNLEFIEHTMKEPIDVNKPEWVLNKICYKL